jgi:hypothetical protein
MLQIYRNASFMELRCRSEGFFQGPEHRSGERGKIEEFTAADVGLPGEGG